jgi:plastocyanin
MNKLFIAVFVVVVLVGGFWFFNQAGAPEQEIASDTEGQGMPVVPSGDEPSVPETVVTPEPSPSPSVAPEASNVKEFVVEGNNFAFSVKEMTVKKGDRVRVVFNNKDGRHDWRLDEFAGAATKVIMGGQSETIEFTADKAGSFEYYCSVGSHRQMGMKGTLTVTE